MTTATAAARETKGRQTTMRAIVQDRYGGLDVLELRAIDRPVPKASEVLVRVHAAGLDRGVWHVMTGLPCMIRFIGFGVCGDPRSASGAWTSPDGSRRSASR
jgi:hypothetical protein